MAGTVYPSGVMLPGFQELVVEPAALHAHAFLSICLVGGHEGPRRS